MDPHSPPPPAPRLLYTRFPSKKNSGRTSAQPRGPPSTTHAFATSFPRSLAATALFSSTHFQPSITALLILTVRSSIPLSTELISAVDVHYKDEFIFSKVQEAEVETGWFLCSPFRVDLLGQKESIQTPIRHVAENEAWLKHLEENLKLNWIMIDPTRNRSANFSSRRPVSIQRHWLTGDVQLRYATIIAGQEQSELVQCAVLVTCEGKAGGEMHVREVSMQVEDLEGKHLNGKESLVIMQRAMESGKRKKERKEEGKERFEEFLVMKKERRERMQSRERALDLVCIAVGVTIFVTFWSFVLFR
jgi:hypothetical protein